MKWNRTIIFGGMTLLAIAGFLGGNFGVQRYFASQHAADAPAPSVPSLPSAFLALDSSSEIGRSRVSDARRDDRPAAGDVTGEEMNGIRYFPFDPTATGADHVAVFEEEELEDEEPAGDDPKADPAPKEAGPELAASAPEKLPAPENASPIAGEGDKQDAAIRDMIEEELPHATRDEQDVWLDELKGMQPAMIRELLQLRRKFGSERPLKFGTIGQTVPPAPTPGTTESLESSERVEQPECFEPGEPLETFEPSSLGEFSDPLWPFGVEGESPEQLQPVLLSLRHARALLLHNMTHANTIGFKRLQVSGVQTATTPVDQSQGRLRKTRQPLDLAIVGQGFFQIQDGAETLYTRAGAFALNAEGELVPVGGEREQRLEPNLALPLEATAIQISTEGRVTVRLPGQPEPREIGRISLVRFVNPSGLEPRGVNLFAATEASGPPLVEERHGEDRSRLRQGYLEASNVDLNTELAELRLLQRQWRAISQAAALLSADMADPPFGRSLMEWPIGEGESVPALTTDSENIQNSRK